MKLLVLACVVCVALSQTAPNLQGTWYTRTASGDIPPAITSYSWPAVTSAFDSVYAISGYSNMTYRYDHHTATWTKLVATPSGLRFRAADLIYTAGNLVLFGGKTANGFDNTMYTLSVNNPTVWTPRINIGTTPPSRNGHTFTLVNGVVYLIGGWNEQQYFNGVWASDISELVSTGAATSTWTQVIPEITGAALFHARNGHTVTVYENRMYLFGGFWHNVQAGGAYTNCLPEAECTWFQDTWTWTVPSGMPQADKNTWYPITPSTVVMPAARYGHAAAMIEDGVMCIYGGIGADQLALNDLWSFLEHRMAWVALSPVGTAPPSLVTPVGANIGKHFILYAGGANVYDYTPYTFDPADWIAPTAQPEPPLSDDCVHHKDVQGINAGIVITILIGIAQLLFIVLVWRHGGGGFSCAAGGKGASPYAAMSS